MINPMKIALIILAGGLSSRMGTNFSKVFYRHRGKPIAQYSLEPFLTIDQIGQIIIVCPQEDRHHFQENFTFALPGKERFLSLERGLKECKKSIEYVLVHDAARPLIVKEDIERLIDEGIRYNGATLGARIRSTLIRANENTAIENIVDRNGLWETHTPQFAPIGYLLKGIKISKELHQTPTDEMSLLKIQGLSPRIVEASFPNIKITYPSDLPLVCSLIDQLQKI